MMFGSRAGPPCMANAHPKSKGVQIMSTTMSESTPQKEVPIIAPAKPKGGLEGIVAATTALSKVEGTAGRLIYRGYNIHDLARTTTFEEVAYLLWFGHLPNQAELVDLKVQLLAERTLSPEVLQVLRNLPATSEPMDVLRTATSAWGAVNVKGKPTREQAIAIT